MFIVSILFGVLIVASAILLLKREFVKALRQQERFQKQAQLYDAGELNDILLNLKMAIDDMNQAFYSISGDLEGKYSVHEKQLADLEAALEKLTSEMPAVVAHLPVEKKEERAVKEHIHLSAREKPDWMKPPVQKTPEEALLEKALELEAQGVDKRQIAKTLGIGQGALDLMMHIKK
ncbi:DUF6115 domain-containing protein [Fusibacter sp. JL298sf-3]